MLNPRWRVKYRLINDFLNGTDIGSSYLIGDTETDILAGKELGYVTIAVQNGIRDRNSLEKVNPDYMIDSLANISRIDFFKLI